MQMARSLVMKPASMVSMQTASSASEKTRSSALLSSLARWRRPRVHAKMEAAESGCMTVSYEPLRYTGCLACSCTITAYRWDWWRFLSPAGVACSGGSRCRGRPRTPPCVRRDKSGRWSSYPESRSLNRVMKDVKSATCFMIIQYFNRLWV